MWGCRSLVPPRTVSCLAATTYGSVCITISFGCISTTLGTGCRTHIKNKHNKHAEKQKSHVYIVYFPLDVTSLGAKKKTTIYDAALESKPRAMKIEKMAPNWELAVSLIICTLNLLSQAQCTRNLFKSLQLLTRIERLA